MKSPSERLQGQLIERCEELTAHVKLLRDYATTPDNVWLAKGELSRITELAGDIEDLLTALNQT